MAFRDDRSNGNPEAPDGGEALLLRTWGDAEAIVVHQLLEQYGIWSRLEPDLPHAVLPLSLDGLGEVRVVVLARRYDEAVQLLAEHRRQGFSLARP
jgi:hypothetical protein